MSLTKSELPTDWQGQPEDEDAEPTRSDNEVC